MNSKIGGLFFPAQGYSDAFFFGSISLIALTLAYVIILCPESRTASTPEVSSRAQENLSVKISPILSARRLVSNFASSLLLPISMLAPRAVPGSSRKNYNMLFVGLGLFLYIVSTVRCSISSRLFLSHSHDYYQGVYTTKYLYAQHVYTWTTAQVCVETNN